MNNSNLVFVVFSLMVVCGAEGRTGGPGAGVLQLSDSSGSVSGGAEHNKCSQ